MHSTTKIRARLTLNQEKNHSSVTESVVIITEISGGAYSYFWVFN